jgi:subtilisin family serine protease
MVFITDCIPKVNGVVLVGRMDFTISAVAILFLTFAVFAFTPGVDDAQSGYQHLVPGAPEQQQYFDFGSQSSIDAAPGFEAPKSDGYLIELYGEPVSAHIAAHASDDSKSAESKEYASGLLASHAQYSSEIDAQLQAFGKKSIEGDRTDLVHSLNGMLMKLGPREKEAIEQLPFVKRVYRLPQVEAYSSHMRQSIWWIGAPYAWANGYNGTGVKVAVIDTGIDYTHPDFGNCTSVGAGCKIAGGYDFVNNDADPMDDMGHGTHVAGIIAADGMWGDGSPMRGVAPGATLYAYKVLNASGSGSGADIIRAFEYVLDPNGDGDESDHLDIASISLGASSNDPEDPMAIAANNMAEGGVVVVVAAGNSGSYETIGSPGTARKAITVGASGRYGDGIAYFSSRGPVKGGGMKPDVMAPGESICSSEWGNAWNGSRCYDERHVSLSGTSMATPHVSGLAALLKQQHPDWSPDEIKYSLRANAYKMASNYNDRNGTIYNVFIQGAGRVFAYWALNSTMALRPIVVELGKDFDTGSAVKFNASIFVNWENSSGEYNYTFDAAYLGTSLRYSSGYMPRPDAWLSQLHGEGNVSLVEGVPATIQFAGIDKTLLIHNGGIYVVRARISGKNRTSEDYHSFTVSPVSIATPYGGDVYGSGFDINGSVIIPAGGHYRIDYAPSGTEGWSDAGISLENGGNSIIEGGEMAHFEPEGMFPSGFYQFRIGIYDGEGLMHNSTFATIMIDRTLRDGFPARVAIPKLNYSGYEGYEYFGSDVISVPSGIGSDGQRGLAFAGHSQDGKRSAVYEIGFDGSVKNVIIAPEDNLQKINTLSLVVHDFDGDGADDVAYNKYLYGDEHREIVQAQNGSVILSLSSNDTPSMPFSLSYPFKSYSVMVDLHRDGKKEMIFLLLGQHDKYIYVTDLNGNAMPGWPQAVPHCSASFFLPSPVVGNFDSDDELEILYYGGSEDACARNRSRLWGKAYIFDANGSVLPGWPVYVNASYTFATPSAADLNGDGIDEVVLPSGALHVFNSTGQEIEGWPQLAGRQFMATAAIGDIDGDGSPEIIASQLAENYNGTYYYPVYAFHADGTELAGWPALNQWPDWEGPVLGDVDGDGKLDVVHGDSSYINGTWFNSIHARNSSGNELAGFPKYSELTGMQGIALDDIDGDGKLDLVSGSEGAYRMYSPYLGPDGSKQTVPRQSVSVWDLGVNVSQLDLVWPAQHRNKERTSRYIGRLSAPYNFNLTDAENGTVLLSWVEADDYPFMQGYIIQISGDENFTNASAVELSLEEMNYSLENMAAGHHYFRVGSFDSKEERNIAWSPAVVFGIEPPVPFCGDAACNSGETCLTCAADCGPCPDITSPFIAIISPSNGFAYNVSALLLDISAEGNATVWYGWNDTNATYIGPVLVAFPEGSNTLVAYANDSSGNMNTTSATFSVDVTAPAISELMPANGMNITGALVSFGWSASDNMIGELNCSLTVNGTYHGSMGMANGSAYATAINLSAYGDYTWDVSCTDEAGNTGSASSAFTLSPAIVSGNASSMNASGLSDAGAMINGTNASDGSAYNGILNVAITDNGSALISFDYNFSAAGLNFSSITITQGAGSDGAAFVTVDGISAIAGTKTLYMYNAGTSFNYICVKDADGIVNVSQISAACSAADETLVPCDGTSTSGYVCAANGSTRIITGLRHSGTRQHYVAPAALVTSGGTGGATTGGGSNGGGFGVVIGASTTTQEEEEAQPVESLLPPPTPATPPAPFCGDGTCGSMENCATCAADCEACRPEPALVTGRTVEELAAEVPANTPPLPLSIASRIVNALGGEANLPLVAGGGVLLILLLGLAMFLLFGKRKK